MNTCLTNSSTPPVCHFRQQEGEIVTFFRCPESSPWGPLQELLFPVPSSVSRGGDRPHSNALNTAGGPIPFLRAHDILGMPELHRGPYMAYLGYQSCTAPRESAQATDKKASHNSGQKKVKHTCHAGTRAVLRERQEVISGLSFYSRTNSLLKKKQFWNTTLLSSLLRRRNRA